MTTLESVQAPDSFPSHAGRILLPGPAGQIEAACDMPQTEPRPATVVLCHPHPPQGGTMNNKVVTTLERSLRELGLRTVRFNFRGVGASEGHYDDGRGESDDLTAVAAWVRQVRPSDALWLAGFSFGSFIAIRDAVRLHATSLITVAPPVDHDYGFHGLTLPSCPWLVVQGEQDEVVDPARVFDWVAGLAKPPILVRMAECGHFFHGRLLELRTAVKETAAAWVP